MKIYTIIAATAILVAPTISMAQTRTSDQSSNQLNGAVLDELRSAQLIQNNLNSRRATVVSTPVAVTTHADPRFYIGAGVSYGGTDLYNGSRSSQLTLGYNVNSYFSAEAVVSGDVTRREAQTVVANALVGYNINAVRPYALVGLGTALDKTGNSNSDMDNIWNYGAGVAYNVNRNWQLDTRYVRTEGFRGERESADRITLGVNYRF